MNIFATDPVPEIAANHLDLKRVIKMILESFQLMSNVMWANGGTGFYKISHKNHPCSHWAGASRENFRWLLQHAVELMAVYSAHYSKVHKCNEHTATCIAHMLAGTFPHEARTPHVNCTEFKHLPDVHKAYRFQMLKKWQADKLAPRWAHHVNSLSLVTEWSQEHAIPAS